MEKPFSGWIEGLPYYLPFFVAGITLAWFLRPWGWSWAAIPVLMLGLAIMLFFRDFPREVQADDKVILAPADGTVIEVAVLEDTPHYQGRALYVAIFMSVFNVHVNRAPCDGTAKEARYAPGHHKNAMTAEANRVNESNALYLDTDAGPVTVRQISGAVARRIVCRAEPGMRLKQGEKFGMIKFGSRVELYLPPDLLPQVVVGAKTRAGITAMAERP